MRLQFNLNIVISENVSEEYNSGYLFYSKHGQFAIKIRVENASITHAIRQAHYIFYIYSVYLQQLSTGSALLFQYLNPYFSRSWSIEFTEKYGLPGP